MNMVQIRQSSSPPSMPSQALDMLVRQLTNALEGHPASRQRSISSRSAPTAAERDALQGRLRDLADCLRPASHETAIRHIGAMRAAFPALSTTETERVASLKVYAAALKEFPEWAIGQACRAAIDGRIGRGQYAPAAPELVAECQRVAAPVREEHVRIATILNAEVYHEPEPEEKARVNAAFDELTRGLAAALDMGEASKRPPLEPLTFEEAEERRGTLAAGLQLSIEVLRKVGIAGDEGVTNV